MGGKLNHQNLSNPPHPIAHYLRHTHTQLVHDQDLGQRDDDDVQKNLDELQVVAVIIYILGIYIYASIRSRLGRLLLYASVAIKNHVELFSLHTWQRQHGCCNLIFLDEVEVRYVALLWALPSSQAILAVGLDRIRSGIV